VSDEQLIAIATNGHGSSIRPVITRKNHIATVLWPGDPHSKLGDASWYYIDLRTLKIIGSIEE
jgi:hypothetical protein